MGTYTGVTYTKIPTKPSVVALQFSTSDLIIYINIILGLVKMWDLREYNTLCLQPSDDTTTASLWPNDTYTYRYIHQTFINMSLCLFAYLNIHNDLGYRLG